MIYDRNVEAFDRNNGADIPFLQLGLQPLSFFHFLESFTYPVGKASLVVYLTDIR